MVVRNGERAEAHAKLDQVIRTLLRATVGLPPATRLELNARTSTPSTTTRSYSRTEVARILSMARRVDAATRSRLAHNHEARATIGCGGGQPAASTDVVIRGEPRSLGAILDHLSTHGCMPPYYVAVRRTESSALREALRIGNSPFITALYPTRAEIYALMIMFTYRTGLNLSTLNNLRVTDAQLVSARGRSRPIYVVRLDKPRRGPAHRSSAITLAGKAARLWERTVAVTQPIRDRLAEVGQPSDRLFLAVAGAWDESHLGGLFISEWDSGHTSRAWHKSFPVRDADGRPLRVNLRRLRKTEQVLNGESRQNTPEESEEHYRKNDPKTIEQAAVTIRAGQTDALDHARTTVARQITADDVALASAAPTRLAEKLGVDQLRVEELIGGALDTVTAGCLDITHSPHPGDDGGDCTASFLLCLACPLGVVAPRHLPRLVVLLDVCERRARSMPPGTRERPYNVHIARLRHLLGQVPKAELKRVRDATTPEDLRVVERLLRRDLDV